jgi:group I intron endonuclease
MSKKLSGIYKIINKVNNKIYIGSSINLFKRKKEHFWALTRGNHHNIILQNSHNKHGLASFAFVIIERCSPEELIPREQHWIDTLCPNYNLSPTAGNTLGFKHSEKTKEKIGNVHRGKVMSEESRRKMSISTSGGLNPNFEKPMSLEQRKKISIASTGVSRNKGENNPNSTMTPELVREIRRKYIKGIHGHIRLAKEYGVSRGCVEGIVTRKRWGHIK